MKIGYATKTARINDPAWEITIHCDRDLAERVLNLYQSEMKHLVDRGEHFDEIVALLEDYRDLRAALEEAQEQEALNEQG